MRNKICSTIELLYLSVYLSFSLARKRETKRKREKENGRGSEIERGTKKRAGGGQK